MRSIFIMLMGLLLCVSCGKKGDGEGLDFLSDPSETTEEAVENVTALEKLKSNPSYSKIAALVEKHQLEDMFEEGENITFFIPTNTAFDAIRDSAVSTLESNPDRARNALKSYIVKGEYNTAKLQELETLTTTKGTIVSVERANGYLWIEGSAILKGDMKFDKGIMHEIEYLYSF